MGRNESDSQAGHHGLLDGFVGVHFGAWIIEPTWNIAHEMLEGESRPGTGFADDEMLLSDHCLGYVAYFSEGMIRWCDDAQGMVTKYPGFNWKVWRRSAHESDIESVVL